jgi:hypothetical protein
MGYCRLVASIAAAAVLMSLSSSTAKGQGMFRLAIASGQTANRAASLIPSYQPCALPYQDIIKDLKDACKARAPDEIIDKIADRLEEALRNVRPRDNYGPEICEQPPVRYAPVCPPLNVIIECPCPPPPCACPASRTK